MPVTDQGYRHWAGQLSRPAWRWLVITKHGVRTGFNNPFLRLVIVFAWVPAIALAGALMIWGLMEQRSSLVQGVRSSLQELVGQTVYLNPRDYRIEAWTICCSTFFFVEEWFAMVVVLIVGTGLISQDMRFNAMPLYFSRPLRLRDYFLGKLGVIGAFLGMVLVAPALVAYLLGILFSRDVTIVGDTLPLLLTSIACGVMMTLSAGLFILALSSLSRNARYIGIFWVCVWIVTGVVSTVLEKAHHEQEYWKSYREVGMQVQLRNADPNLVRTMNAIQSTAFVGGGAIREVLNAKAQAIPRNANDEIYERIVEESKSDWRPLISYPGNLTRVGDALLGTDACWRTLSKTQAEGAQGPYLWEHAGPQYPWSWSAAVLIVLLGISACILNFRMRTLDRLK